MTTVLIVEDEHDIATVVRDVIVSDDTTVELASNGVDALRMLQQRSYDLIILDWMLPGIAGVDLCKAYRASGGQGHVLMLTARTSVDEKALALDVGADDYLCKPFHLKELIARVRALLRRPTVLLDRAIDFAGWTFMPSAGVLERNGERITLLPREADLLLFLLTHAGAFFSAEALVQRVWTDSLVQPETVRTHIKNIRRKLDRPDFTGTIDHIRGYGYAVRQ